jgi:uncharacterized protein (TIRG00374 family)
MSRRVQAVAGFGLAALVIGGFLSAVGPGRVLAELSGARPLPLAAGVVAVVGAFYCWREALRRLLAGLGQDVGGFRYRLAFMSGEFLKQVIPMGHSGGPVFVSYAVSRETDAPYEESLAAATVVEFLNIGASILLAATGMVALLATRDGPLGAVLVALVTGLVIAALVLCVAAVLVYTRRALVERGVLAAAGLLRGTLGRVSARARDALAAERIAATFGTYYGAFDTVLAERAQVRRAVLFSLLGWALFVTPLYASFRALGEPVPYALVAFVIPVVSLVNVVPTPGGLGGFEVALAAIIVALVGVEFPVATAGVFLYRLINYWLVVLLGGIASVLFSMGLSEAPPALGPDEDPRV